MNIKLSIKITFGIPKLFYQHILEVKFVFNYRL